MRQMEQIVGVKLPPEASEKVQAFQNKLLSVMAESMTWESYKQDFIRIYSAELSEDQFQDLVAFYKTPTGKAFIAKTPALMTKSSELSQTKMAEMIPQIQKLMNEFTESMTPEKP